MKKIGARGTLTIPTDVRAALGVDEGDLVEVEVRRIVRFARVPDDETVTTAQAIRGPDP